MNYSDSNVGCILLESIKASILGFLLILALSAMSAYPTKKATVDATKTDVANPPTSPDATTARSAPVGSPYGTMQTPAGRRSARISRKQPRKEDWRNGKCCMDDVSILSSLLTRRWRKICKRLCVKEDRDGMREKGATRQLVESSRWDEDERNNY